MIAGSGELKESCAWLFITLFKKYPKAAICRITPSPSSRAALPPCREPAVQSADAGFRFPNEYQPGDLVLQFNSCCYLL